MESFKEWLYAQLVNDDYIDSYEVSEDDITEEMLYQETEVEEYDMENYRAQFIEHCDAAGVRPVWDVE